MFMGAMPGETLPDPAGRYDIPFVALPEAGTDPRVMWLEALAPVVAALDEAGVTWSWVNDHALQSGDFSARADGRVLLANLPALPLETLDALEQVEGDGHAVGLIGPAPQAVPGFDPDGSADAALERRMAGYAPAHALSRADVVNWAQAQLENRMPGTIRRVSRRVEDGFVHFLVNQSAASAEAAFAPGELGEGVALNAFDPATGAVWPVSPGDDGLVHMTLAGMDSRFLVIGPDMAAAGPVPASVRAPAMVAHTLPANDWTLHVGDASRPLGDVFPDWRDAPDLIHASDAVVYSTTVDLDGAAAARVRALDLGRVEGQALVRINGGPARRLALDPFVLDLPEGLDAGPVTIEIQIIPPRRNALAGQGVSGEAGMEFLASLNDALTPAGLMGPVRLLSDTGDDATTGESE